MGKNELVIIEGVEVRRRVLPITSPNHPDFVEHIKVKENKVIVIS